MEGTTRQNLDEASDVWDRPASSYVGAISTRTILEDDSGVALAQENENPRFGDKMLYRIDVKVI